jgi:cytoskeletal protein CcmA (bactofilin family)
MLLQSGCFFQRLNAPCIVMGSPEVTADGNGSFASAISTVEPTPERPARRRLIEGDWEIQPGEVVRENIVSRGKLHIGAGARIFGSAKSNSEMVVGPDVVVEGSLISAATMHIGPRCQIRGPVISEREMVIQSGAQCGAPQIPTTVSAPIIDAEEGSLFFGTLWAREQGRVIPKS